MHPRAKTRMCGPLVCVVLGGILACGPPPGGGASPYRGRLLPTPWPKIGFTLTATDATPYDFRKETDGYVTLLFFGYSNCPDICPVHLANIAAVLHKLPPSVANQVRVVFVTTDAERDTPQRIRAWLDQFDHDFVGLRGSLDTVNAIQRAIGLPPAVIDTTEAEEYLVGHAAPVIAYTRDNLAHVVYPFGIRQADWAHDLPSLVNETWQGDVR